MRLGSLITLLADCGIPLLLSWSNSPKELQKGEWWINLIIASCVVKYHILLYCPPTPLGALHFISSTQGERYNIQYCSSGFFFPFRFNSKGCCRLNSMCWGFSSWNRGFRAFLVPSNPPGTKCQGWFSWWLSDPPAAPTREGSLLGGFQNAKPQQWICWRFLGHWAPHPDCAEAAWRENPSHDKEMETNGAGPLSSGAQCLQSWQLLPTLSQLTQHSCQRSPGRAVCSRADFLCCAAVSGWDWEVLAFRAELSQPLPWNRAVEMWWCLLIPGSLLLTWEAWLCPTSPLEQSYPLPSSFPFLRLLPLGACCQP